METSASFEARYAPSSYPTRDDKALCSSRSQLTNHKTKPTRTLMRVKGVPAARGLTTPHTGSRHAYATLMVYVNVDHFSKTLSMSPQASQTNSRQS